MEETMMKLLWTIKDRVKNDWQNNKDVIFTGLIFVLLGVVIILLICPIKYQWIVIGGMGAGYCAIGIILLFLASK